jgi:chromosome segregation protein
LLRLKKLELVGFKSFCDRQELRFNGDGIAAVVGPNGCGKSNISDSISWVLGERSAKSLRGGSMQDVIFNGSRDRKPSGMATVSITLLDPQSQISRLHGGQNGHATNGHGQNGHGANGVNGINGSNGTNGVVYPVDSHGEITVSRKLFRSGESDYLINGKSCRLRDIQDLFMGSGLGPEHYAIIEQGRIGQILSSRPLDRRSFLEEAAGVTKFKARKRLAEFKLESARQNLNRVNDILQEVTRQVGSLKRQAARARRYEELKAQLVEKLSLVLANRYREIDGKVRSAQSEIETANEQVRESATKTHEIEVELGETRRLQQQQEHDLETGRAELSQLTVETERLQSRIEQQAQLAEENLRRKTQAEAEIAHLAERLTQLQAELAAIEFSTGEITATSEETRQRLGEKSAELEQHSRELRGREEQQERSRQDVIRLLGEVSSLRNKLAQMDEFLAGNERQAARAREEEAVVVAESAEVERRRAEIEHEVETLQTSADALAARRREIEEQLAALREEAQTRRKAADQMRSDLSRLTARRDSLEEILSHHAYTTETVKNLFAAIQREPVEGFKPIGILADYIEVDPKHERATEEFLREELEYVVVANWDEARLGVQLVRNDMQGYVTFLVHPESPVQAEIPALGPETGVVGRLADAIRLTNGLSGSASTLGARPGERAHWTVVVMSCDSNEGALYGAIPDGARIVESQRSRAKYLFDDDPIDSGVAIADHLRRDEADAVVETLKAVGAVCELI